MLEIELKIRKGSSSIGSIRKSPKNAKICDQMYTSLEKWVADFSKTAKESEMSRSIFADDDNSKAAVLREHYCCYYGSRSSYSILLASPPCPGQIFVLFGLYSMQGWLVRLRSGKTAV